MAQATVELRHLMKTSNFKLFDFDYTFDDTAFKKKLELAVIDHYYFAEIGQETPDHFKHVFKTRWLRMIDYYNKLHNTTLLSYNPLINHSMSEAMEQLSKTSNTMDTISDTKQNTTNDSTQNTSNDSTTDSTNTTTGDNHSFSDSTTKNSDYPQQAIAGGDFLAGESNTIQDTTSEDSSKTTGKVTAENTSTTTADSTSKLTADNTSKTTGSGSTNTDYERTIEGLTGTTYQDLIMKERETLIRITNMVIEELKPCFMLVY